jgi:hypothetical protein
MRVEALLELGEVLGVAVDEEKPDHGVSRGVRCTCTPLYRGVCRRG